MRLKGHRPFYCNQYTKWDIRLYCHLTKLCAYNNPYLAQQRRITIYHDVFKTVLHNLFLSGSPFADYLAVDFIVRGFEILISLEKILYN